MTHSSSLQKSLDEFAATRARTLAMVDGLTQEQFDFVPAPNRWSIGEVLDHMLRAERLNRDHVTRLIRIKREGQKPELRLTFSDLNVSVAGLPGALLSLFEGPLTLMNMFVPDRLRNYLTRTRVVPFRNPDRQRHTLAVPALSFAMISWLRCRRQRNSFRTILTLIMRGCLSSTRC